MNLGGRSFLHDYHFEDDENFSVLELIMTAPMVVTHWINLQYYASTVDNARYGSGNKVLHNVVGGHIGVFEGNGGDLRIGLPMQSLHNGSDWVHTPLRLSVFIEAPREAIAAVLGKHAGVRALVDNGWLHLFQFDAAEGAVYEMDAGSQWIPKQAPRRRKHWRLVVVSRAPPARNSWTNGRPSPSQGPASHSVYDSPPDFARAVRAADRVRTQ
jgi:uncharacterized protein YbcC (UPF0753/DUF2309 family)